MTNEKINITQAEREMEVEPNGMLNHGWREAMPFVQDSHHWGLPKANEHGSCRDWLA